MAESKLRTLSIDFAVQILNLVKFLKSQHETIVSNQIGRAGKPKNLRYSFQSSGIFFMICAASFKIFNLSNSSSEK